MKLPSTRRSSTTAMLAVALATLAAGLAGCATPGSAAPTSPSAPAAPSSSAPAPAVAAAQPVALATAAAEPTAPPTGETITLYNAQHKQTTAAVIAAFTRHTGIAVKETDKDESELTAQIEEEGAKSPGDVFYTENANWLQALSEKNMLAKIDQPTLAGVPAADSAPDGTWVGVSERISTLVYNPAKIGADQLPKSVFDMAKPEYKGKFELAAGETDFWPIVVSAAKAQGEEATTAWLKALKENAGDNGGVPDFETLVSDVSQGTTAFALINHYYYYRLAAEVTNGAGGAKLAYFAPQDPGFLGTVSAAGILASSQHQAAAQKFLEFMTSELGQSILATGYSFEYPLRSGVAANPALPPLASYQINAFGPVDMGDGTEAKNLLQKSGLI